jgi:hypothetical protein
VGSIAATIAAQDERARDDPGGRPIPPGKQALIGKGVSVEGRRSRRLGGRVSCCTRAGGRGGRRRDAQRRHPGRQLRPGRNTAGHRVPAAAPGVEVRVREVDLTDPTCGLRTGLVDVALTRGPFDQTGLTVHELRADPVGAVLRADDPLARRDRLTLADLADRRWFRFPDGTDPIWQSYWNGGQHREGPVVRAVQECLQAVLWNGTVGMTPLGHHPPEELAVVPLTDMAPSPAVVAWNPGDANPLIRSFVQVATATYRD